MRFSAVTGGAIVNGNATTAMRSDAAPARGPLSRDLDFGAFNGVNAADPTAAARLATSGYDEPVAQRVAPKIPVSAATGRPVGTQISARAVAHLGRYHRRVGAAARRTREGP
ncbi:MAG: hypothetical protein K8T90_15650 [Planctomycetes bacterium]|nr:hypothetical protein [Planctomycetota bacterium]